MGSSSATDDPITGAPKTRDFCFARIGVVVIRRSDLFQWHAGALKHLGHGSMSYAINQKAFLIEIVFAEK